MIHETFLEFRGKVEYDHQPYEPATADYPGCDASVTVTSIRAGSVEIMPAMPAWRIESLAKDILRSEMEKRRDQQSVMAEIAAEEQAAVLNDPISRNRRGG